MRKINEQEECPPYPGVVIEEMLDSASVHNENYPMVLHTGDTKPQQEPDVRKMFKTHPVYYVEIEMPKNNLERKTFLF